MSATDLRSEARVDRRSVLPWRRHHPVDVEVAPLVARYRERHRRTDTTLIERAFEVARDAHAEDTRGEHRDGNPGDREGHREEQRRPGVAGARERALEDQLHGHERDRDRDDPAVVGRVGGGERARAEPADDGLREQEQEETPKAGKQPRSGPVLISNLDPADRFDKAKWAEFLESLDPEDFGKYKM